MKSLARPSGGSQTFLVPHTRDAFQGVNLVTAVKKFDGLHFRGAPGKFELLGLELIVILPGLEEFLEERAVRDAHFAADFELRLVQAFGLSHRRNPTFVRVSILQASARPQLLFRCSVTNVPRAEASTAPAYPAR